MNFVAAVLLASFIRGESGTLEEGISKRVAKMLALRVERSELT